MSDPTKEKIYYYKVLQRGFIVARVESRDKERAEREIQDYAMVYKQDGPVRIVRRSYDQRED